MVPWVPCAPHSEGIQKLQKSAKMVKVNSALVGVGSRSLLLCLLCIQDERAAKRREEEEEEEFFNHYKNDLERHAHTPSGVAGTDLKSQSGGALRTPTLSRFSPPMTCTIPLPNLDLPRAGRNSPGGHPGVGLWPLAAARPDANPGLASCA